MRALSLLAVILVGCGGVVREAPATESDTGGTCLDDACGADTGIIERPPAETGTIEPTPACSRTSDRLSIALSGAITASCATTSAVDGGGGAVTRTGQIVRVSAQSFDLDTCSPAADCIANITTITLDAPGLDLRSLKINSYVKVSYSFGSFWGCQQSIVVESIDSWSGVKNPADVGGKIYVAGGDGADPILPFSIERVPTHCYDPTSGSCGGGVSPDWFAYRIAGTSIAMGTTASLSANGQELRARNLRAFYEGACDAYWDYAFWIVAD